MVSHRGGSYRSQALQGDFSSVSFALPPTLAGKSLGCHPQNKTLNLAGLPKNQEGRAEYTEL